MTKRFLGLVVALAALAANSFAQSCVTDEMHRMYMEEHPEIRLSEQALNKSIASFIESRSAGGIVAAKTTAVHNDTDWYDIPLVVHIVHNYGTEDIPDSNIYQMVKQMNTFYAAQNNLSPIIQPFKKYIGKAKVRFRLASVDPLGNPTKGITRRFSYLTFGGDDQAKMDQWPPRNYYNIWLENVIGRGVTGGIVLAYATFPSDGESLPYYDGVIARADAANDASGTIPHETGHYLSLYHPWNSGAGVGEVCGDDEVDDTPPTKGHFGTCSSSLYDTTCAANYYKIYVSASGVPDSLVNYPDTTNTQNVMDYSACTDIMLTKGQVARIRAALNNSIGGRNNLWDSTNLAATGLLAPYPDLQPVADFCARQTISPSSTLTWFTFPGVPLFFTNKSWGDTVTKVEWTFSNTADKPNFTADTYAKLNQGFDNKFTDPGWVKIKMDVTGNNSGTTTANFDHSIFVADATGVDGTSYMQEFGPDADRDKWPTFNYYNNEFKWQIANVGFYDGYSMMYKGYDDRTGIALLKGTPKGDFDDLYSVPFNLEAYKGAPSCNLNFHSAAASRTSSSANITDTLVIEYSVDKKHSWTTLTKLGKSTLINNGTISTSFTPTGFADWRANTINIPEQARSSYTVFRFRYRPGTFVKGTSSTGNNFYMDRVQVSPWPAEASLVSMANMEVKVVPNPTQGDAFVLVKDVSNATVNINVTDITGKTVYAFSEQLRGSMARVQIPHDAISVKGVYLVQVNTGKQVTTQKLVVY